jgi:DNA-binding HxlR family transcriptional regulator
MELALLLPPGMAVTPTMKEHCPLRDTLDRIGDRWTVIVVVLLLPGPRRFTELQRAAEGISQRMLTHTLRGLQRDGLATRTVHACVPPKVEYELTPAGHALAGPLTELLHWSVRFQETVLAARRTYDMGDVEATEGR